MTATRTAGQQLLLEKIRQHLANLNARNGFTARLARENGWTLPFARQAVDEYAKFLFIAREGGHPVSPPKIIDQAWHLHLVHTEDYWGDFCPNVLRMQLHHSPATGTHGESARFADWSGQTCASYRKFFGPPPAMWLDSPRPFAGTSRLVVGPLVGAGFGVILAIAGLGAGSLVTVGIGLALTFAGGFSALYLRSQMNPGGLHQGGSITSCGGTSCSASGGLPGVGDASNIDQGGHGHGGHSGGGHDGGGGHSCGGGGHGCGGGGSCGGGGH